MGHKVTSFSLALVFFFAAIVIVSVEANSCCSYSKRSYNPLDKRTEKESEKCPCALAQAIFTKNVTGITVYSQNECGVTTVTGFLSGLKDPSKNRYEFLIVDQCGNLIRNLTDTLNAKIASDGTTQFTAKVNDLNLNCDKDGILNIYCKTPKQTYYYKRDGQGVNMRINENGGEYALADISQV